MINWQLSKQGICWTVPPDLIAGSGIGPSRSSILWGYLLTGFWFSNGCRLKFNFFKCMLMSGPNKILISIWPRTRKFNQLLQVGKAVTFDSPWSRVSHALRPIFILWLVKIWQVSSCGTFMQHLETCLLIAEVDRVMFHLVMFLTVFFHWKYTMKYSCFQDSSVIYVWFVYWVFGWEMRCLSKSLEIGCHHVHLAWCVRGSKSWPYLIAFRRCSISTSKPEQLTYLMFVVVLFCFLFLVLWSRA